MNGLGRRRLLGFGVAAAIDLTAPVAARAEAGGEIVGRVLDATGAPVGSARVIVASAFLADGEVALATESDGRFRLGALDDGFYDLTVEIEGGRRGVFRDVGVTASRTTRVEITLEARPANDGGY